MELNIAHITASVSKGKDTPLERGLQHRGDSAFTLLSYGTPDGALSATFLMYENEWCPSSRAVGSNIVVGLNVACFLFLLKRNHVQTTCDIRTLSVRGRVSHN